MNPDEIIVGKVQGQGILQTGTTSQMKVAVLANSFPMPLKKQNQATISFARLPLEKGDLQLLKQWIDLMAEILTEASSEEPPQ